MIKLKALLEADVAAQQAAPQAPVAPMAPETQASNEYSPAFDFNDFENKLSQATETAKNNFQERLLSKVGGKKVLIRASKGYGQPKKDYTINVSSVSIDYYYERYVIILKDEKEKEYFLDTGMKIKILGAAEAKKVKSTQPVKAPSALAPTPAPEQAPNVSTQGI